MRKSLRKLSLDELLEKCQEEQARPREEEEGYCFEMFRRMIEDQNDAAMACIDYLCDRWKPKWIKSSKLDEGEAEDIFQQGLRNMRRSCINLHIPLDRDFNHSGELFGYLRNCVTTASIGYQRCKERERKLVEGLRGLPWAEFLTQLRLEDEIYRQEAIQLATKWIREVATPLERLLIRLWFVDDLTAPQIVKRHPDKFPDESTAYKILYRILRKIRKYLSDQGYDGKKGRDKR